MILKEKKTKLEAEKKAIAQSDKKAELSTLGITVKKSENFSEWFSQICGEQGAKLADMRYGVQGFVVYRPWAFRIVRKMYELWETAVEADNHEPFLFPVVIPEENFQKEKEHAGFTPDVFWVTHAGAEKLERRVGLRPTGETAIYPMYSLWIRTYRNLPAKFYQSRITVFRNEKTTRPFLRGREFFFFETHDVFRTHEEAIAQIIRDMNMMESIARKKLKLPFLFFKRPKWDAFKGAVDTYASDIILPDGRRNQVSSTHDLGHNFAKAFNITFTDEDGSQKFGYQTCFGPGIARLMASIIAVHGDDKGLILPWAITPLHIIIIPILFSKDDATALKVKSYAEKIKKALEEEHLSVKIDESESTPGFKFNQWEMLGVPLRIEIGPREVDAEKITIVRRTNNEKASVSFTQLSSEIKHQAQLLDEEIQFRADASFKTVINGANDFSKLKDIMKKHRGFVRVAWCSRDKEGEACADILKSETEGGVVCGEIFNKEESPSKDETCIICKKTATVIMYAAKSI